MKAETDSRRRPRPPEGQGPILEWFRDTPRYVYQLAFAALCFMLVVTTAISWGFSWTADWVMWIIVLLLPLIMLRTRRHWMAAGADWFAANTGWARIYELTEIELAGNNISPRLYLADAHGNRVHAELRRMQANPRLWDLVYNGIQHSVHTHNPKINKAARSDVVEYRPRHANWPHPPPEVDPDESHRAGPDQVG